VGWWGLVLLFKSGAAGGVGPNPSLCGSRFEFYRVAKVDLTLREDARVNAAPSGVELLRDADEFSVDERPLDGFARIGKGIDFENDLIPDLETHSRGYQVPIDAFDRDVLSDGSDFDRVSFGLEGMDPLQGINADSSVRPTVVFCVVLVVPFKP